MKVLLFLLLPISLFSQSRMEVVESITSEMEEQDIVDVYEDLLFYIATGDMGELSATITTEGVNVTSEVSEVIESNTGNIIDTWQDDIKDILNKKFVLETVLTKVNKAADFDSNLVKHIEEVKKFNIAKFVDKSITEATLNRIGDGVPLTICVKSNGRVEIQTTFLTNL